MRKRFYKIIVACFLLIINVVAYGQQQPKKTPLSTLTVVSAYRPSYTQKYIRGSFNRTDNLPAVRILPLTISLQSIITPDTYTRQFGFFCRKELQIEKVTGIPFRFRLGSLAYSNALEGK